MVQAILWKRGLSASSKGGRHSREDEEGLGSDLPFAPFLTIFILLALPRRLTL
jgi:hypothetical protein